MKKMLILSCFAIYLLAQNLYFDAFSNIRKAKKLLNTNPDKAKVLFIEAYANLKRIANDSIDNNKPSANAFNLIGKMYLNGWGVEQNKEKAVQFLCAAKQLGNSQAGKTVSKLGIKCKKINFKELKQ
jgi:TPR repeat protein